MRYLSAIVLSLFLAVGPVSADDKKPRDDRDKKEQPQKSPESKLDKAKDELKKHGDKNADQSTGEDDANILAIVDFLTDHFPHNLAFSYASYPYDDSGMFQQSGAASRPVYIETGLSAFTGFNRLKARAVNLKVKFYTIAGFEYSYSGLMEKTRFYDSDMKIHRAGFVLNLLTNKAGVLEAKLGFTKIIDVGSGPMAGLELTLAPIRPLIVRGNLHIASINDNNTGDYMLALGCMVKPFEIYGGYRVYSFPGENIDGPTGGIIFRF